MQKEDVDPKGSRFQVSDFRSLATYLVLYVGIVTPNSGWSNPKPNSNQ